MRLMTLVLTLFAALACGFAAAPARADIQVNVNRGDVQPLPIAIPAFGGGRHRRGHFRQPQPVGTVPPAGPGDLHRA